MTAKKLGKLKFESNEYSSIRGSTTYISALRPYTRTPLCVIRWSTGPTACLSFGWPNTQSSPIANNNHNHRSTIRTY